MHSLNTLLQGTKVASVDDMLDAYETAAKVAGVPGMIGSVVQEGTSVMSGLGKAIRQAGHAITRPVGAAAEGAAARSAGSAGPIQSAVGRGVSAFGRGVQKNPGIALGTAAGAGALGAGFVAGRATS